MKPHFFRHWLYLGVFGFGCILWLWADSLCYRTSANWYFDDGFIVLVQEGGQLSVLRSNMNIPWEDPGGINGRFNRFRFESPLEVKFSKITERSEGGVYSQLIELPYVMLLGIFGAFWLVIWWVDPVMIRVRPFDPTPKFVDSKSG
jgi:hypothetical protein